MLTWPRLLGVLWLCGLLWAMPPAAAEDAADPPPSLTLTALRLDPPDPGPDQLCRLWVTIHNGGSQPASLLQFRVRLNGRDVGTYGDDSFVVHIAPQASQDVRLFNVWSSETGRPAAADGRLQVEVILEAASWIDVDEGSPAENVQAGDAAEAVTTWTILGPVEGLPSTVRHPAVAGGAP